MNKYFNQTLVSVAISSILAVSYAGGAKAECYRASPWRMGDATEFTYNGKLNKAGRRYKLSMPNPDGALPGTFVPKFSLASWVVVPQGTYKIDYEFDADRDDIKVQQRISSDTIDLSLNDIYEPSSITVIGPDSIAFSIGQIYSRMFDATISELHFCNSYVAKLDQNNWSVSNWEDQARAFLVRQNKPSEFLANNVLTAHPTLRCIKLNNYWCLKDVGWSGSLGHDSDEHTAFTTAVMGARAAARNFRTAYFVHGRKTARQILAAYSPSNDCRGSNAARREDGTCVHGYNDDVQAAKAASANITDDIDVDLSLFDSNGIATTALITFLANLSLQETGLRASDEVIRQGIALESE